MNAVEAGALSDMVTFTPSGDTVLVANEGEQVRDDDGNVVEDPDGSLTLIDITSGVMSAAATQIGFEAFDARLEELRARGVRLLEDDVSADLEPEYIAVSADGGTAFVTLQEDNAFAVLDLATAAVVDVLPLGVKDFSRGLPTLVNYELTESERPVLGTASGGQEIRLGGLSGLWCAEDESAGDMRVFYTIPDPSAPVFVDYVNNRDFIGNAELGFAGDLGPEGLEFVAAGDSPTGRPLLIVGNEVSGTTTVYTINIAP